MQVKSSILTPFQLKSLHKALNLDLRPEFYMRIQIMLLANEGKSQSQICQQLGCSQITARHWMTIARSGLAHTWQEQPVGRPNTITSDYVERLKEIVSHSPREYGYPFQRWTSQWLSKHLFKEFDIDVSNRHINRLLKQMGLSTRGNSSTPLDQAEPQPSANLNIRIADLKANSAEDGASLFLTCQSS